MKTKKQKTPKTETPAMSEGEKRTRDVIAAAQVQIIEERNQKGEHPAPEVTAPAVAVEEKPAAPAYAGTVPTPEDIADPTDRRAYAAGFRRGFAGLNAGFVSSRFPFVARGWKAGRAEAKARAIENVNN
jgi:hypothetical protein